MGSSVMILVISLALCVALSAFFSASETAYAAVNRVRLKTLAQDGDRKAARALALADDYDRLITGILIGNNLVNIAGTSIATVLFTGWVGPLGPTVSTVVMTLVILLFGEISPKTLAKQFAEQVAMGVAAPLNAVITLLTPVNALFSVWRRMLGHIFKPRENAMPIEAELMTMVDEAQQEGGMDSREGDLIRSAIEFIDQDALDIMTPRVDVTAIEDTLSMEEAQTLFRESGYSRLPVYHEDLDHIVGVLHEKDLYSALHEGVRDLRRVMVPPVYAPATLKISKLLHLCQSTRTHLVIVLDEFGGTEGIVTIEDVLEELVGEIYDEHDDVNEAIVALEDGSMVVDGSLPLAELLERLKLEDHYEADTVGGWTSEMLGRIPTVGAAFTEEGYQVTVVGMDRRRVTKVRVSRAESEDNEAAETPSAHESKEA